MCDFSVTFRFCSFLANFSRIWFCISSRLVLPIIDGEFLTDTELFTQVTKIVKSGYGLNALKDLSKAQKLDLARKLHYDYRSSNGQIRRTLGLTQYEVDSLFPLSADKNK